MNTATKQINWSVSKEDQAIIFRIAKRAVRMARQFDGDYDMISADMDITACHANGMPLRLHDLLNFDDSNFGHDVFGIRRHINRQTGQIENFFVPRCAAQQS